jgi:dipeptidyl aminopeptidase/acylaminoacyl peptidase
MKKVFTLIIALFLMQNLLSASEQVIITSWLSTTPFEVNYPLFYDTPNVKGNTFTDRQLLSFGHVNLDGHQPEAGKELVSINGQSLTWMPLMANDDGFVLIEENAPGDQPQIVWMAAYLQTGRWLEASLELHSPYMMEARLNGKVIGTKTGIDTDEDNIGKLSHDLKLPRGTHLLTVKMLRPPQNGQEWRLKGIISLEEPYEPTNILPKTSPEGIKDILHFMDGVKISSVRPSPDGSLFAISYRQSLPPSDRSESWTEIRRFSDIGLVHSFRHASVSRLGWLPQSNAVSYTSTRDGKTTIYHHNLETGEKQIIAEGLEDFSGMRWSPDESYIIYTIREEGSGTDATMRHILGMQDRQGHFRHRSFLYKLDVASGLHTRLTHGSQTTSLHDISPDSSKLVFSQTRPDYLERPYFKHDLFIMDIKSFTVDTLLANKRWSVSTRFSPDGTQLLATGGPSAFDRIGENIPDGMIANNYDTQAFLLNLDDRSVKPITFDFDPSVASVYWHAVDNHIYILAGENDYRRLFRYDVRRDRIDRIETASEYISSINFASNERVATFIGNKANEHPKAYTLNLRNDSYTLLEDTDAERYRHVVFGDVREWDFTASTGAEISGRYYLPPDFDPEKKYPMIVYQYGGTNPVSRAFGGRYPLNIWAGHGYVVYVLQPSGATGFGQAFSAAHVNNWGKTVADEIIEGTQKFLDAHPFVDPERVGVAGASYGGFMTMLLLTHTDIFATGISHAGISSIASYWGEGYYGFSYSAEATANRFPWDSPEIYIGQSPLYRADKVNTPLLLITGDSDTNVPPGESIQMYTALKLLGREVELVLVEGENHHILTYNKRLQWHDAFMAWWDKYLKGQPEWWEEQFPGGNY